MAAFLIERLGDRVIGQLKITVRQHFDLQSLNGPIAQFFASRISTTSESVCPCTSASLLPSKDQWKS